MYSFHTLSVTVNQRCIILENIKLTAKLVKLPFIIVMWTNIAKIIHKWPRVQFEVDGILIQSGTLFPLIAEVKIH